MFIKFLDIQVGLKVRPERFISFSESRIDSPMIIEGIVIENTAALIGLSYQGRYIVKMIEPRKWHEVVKMLWGRSRVHKEVRGNRRLQSIGIKVPKIHAYGAGFFPPFQYIGFIQMDNLVNQGAQDASQLLYWANRLPADLRACVYVNIIGDLKRMRDHYLVFSDLTLGNIMVYPDGTIAWIDTGVTSYSRLRSAKFHSKFNFAIARFLDIHQNVLTNREYALFQSIMFKIEN